MPPFMSAAAGGRGKTEMWHIVSAEPGAHILLGLKPGADKKAFLAGLENDTLEVPVSASFRFMQVTPSSSRRELRTPSALE